MQRLAHHHVSGLVFAAIGGFFSIYSLIDLELGSAFNMGPGYFPLILGITLAIVGVAIVMGGGESDGEPDRPIPWRGLILVLLAPFIFAVAIRWMGLALTIAAMVMVSSFAAPGMRLRTALSLAAAITLLCVLVFHTALDLPIPLFPRWFVGF